MSQAVRTTERWWKTGATSVLVAAGLLSGLLVGANGQSGRVQAVVVARPGHLAAAEQLVKTEGGHITSELNSLGSITTDISRVDLASVAASPDVASATPDGDLTLRADSASYDPTQDPNSLASVETSTGVRSLWANYTGAGVGVALIDSGVTALPGVLDQVVAGPNFSTSHRRSDVFGHGTFMAGIIAGDQGNLDPVANADNGGNFFGVAPSSTLVSVKVADDQGQTSLLQIMQGINWVITNRATYNIKVINLSFGTLPQDSYIVDPLDWAAEQAWQAGIVVVVSSGNAGAQSTSLADPANDPFVVAVGAEDTSTGHPSVASFSSWGDGARNPDLLAPGAHIQSVLPPTSTIATQFRDTAALGSGFFRGSGSSEAAAYTSGLAALLVQEHPSFNPDQIKALLVGSAQPLAGVDPKAQGNGVVDPAAAAGPVTGALAAAVAVPQSYPASNPFGRAPDASAATPPSNCSQVGLGRNRTGVDYSGRNLHGANLQKASLADTSAPGVTITAASIGSASPSTTQFLKTVTGTGETPPVGQACASVAASTGSAGAPSGSSWSGSSWSGSSWSGSSWSGSSWSGSSWSGSSWSGSSWSGSSWSGSSWSTATWS